MALGDADLAGHEDADRYNAVPSRGCLESAPPALRGEEVGHPYGRAEGDEGAAREGLLDRVVRRRDAPRRARAAGGAGARGMGADALNLANESVDDARRSGARLASRGGKQRLPTEERKLKGRHELGKRCALGVVSCQQGADGHDHKRVRLRWARGPTEDIALQGGSPAGVRGSSASAQGPCRRPQSWLGTAAWQGAANGLGLRN